MGVFVYNTKQGNMAGYIINKKNNSIMFAIIYMAFCFLCIIYSEVLFANYFSQPKTWQDVASYQFELVEQNLEDGVLTNTYGISTPEQLAGLFIMDNNTNQSSNDKNVAFADSITSMDNPNEVSKINNEYILINDVDMSGRNWTPTENFTSIFNGNYHVISNLTITSSSLNYVGMVQKLTGTIKNIFLKNITVTNNNTSDISQGGAGSVAGECFGDIYNVTVLSGSITGPAYQNGCDRKTGGIAGALTNNGVIQNCINYATVSRSKASGGIVGRQYNGEVSFCYNYGVISNDTDAKNCDPSPRVGGICGDNTSSGGKIVLCVNYADITIGVIPTSCNGIMVGGIVGATEQAISKCANYGDVEAGYEKTVNVYSPLTYAGGIAGYANGCNISNCYNIADITVWADEVTGIKVTDKNILNKFDCTTYNDVLVYENSGAAWSYKQEMYYTREEPEVTEFNFASYGGGIAGYCSNSVIGCYTVGLVMGGGVHGYNISIKQKIKTFHSGLFGAAAETKYSEWMSFSAEFADQLYTQPIANCPNIVSSYYQYSSDNEYGIKMYIRTGNNFFNSLDYIDNAANGGIGAGISAFGPGKSYYLYVDKYSGVGRVSGFNYTEISGADEGNYNPSMLVRFKEKDGILTATSTIEGSNKDLSNSINSATNSVIFSMEIGGPNLDTSCKKLESELKSTHFTEAYWATNADINNGYPYLKELFW